MVTKLSFLYISLTMFLRPSGTDSSLLVLFPKLHSHRYMVIDLLFQHAYVYLITYDIIVRVLAIV